MVATQVTASLRGYVAVVKWFMDLLLYIGLSLSDSHLTQKKRVICDFRREPRYIANQTTLLSNSTTVYPMALIISEQLNAGVLNYFWATLKSR